jgi:hypothetical protein
MEEVTSGCGRKPVSWVVCSILVGLKVAIRNETMVSQNRLVQRSNQV